MLRMQHLDTCCKPGCIRVELQPCGTKTRPSKAGLGAGARPTCCSLVQLHSVMQVCDAVHASCGCCRKKLAKLTLEVAGEDLTKAEARLTQAAIEEHLAVNLLARVAFHGQTDITALLEVAHCVLNPTCLAGSLLHTCASACSLFVLCPMNLVHGLNISACCCCRQPLGISL